MRETKKINIENNEFEVKTYATAREATTIQQAYFKGQKVEVVGDQPKIAEFNPGVQFEVEKELVNQMVVALNGDQANLVDRIIDLPNDIYRQLITQLDEIVSKKKS